MQRDSGVGLSAAALKWIAAAAMTADHIGIVFSAALPAGAQLILRTAGRIALPLFCFFVAEGARRTGRPADTPCVFWRLPWFPKSPLI